MIHERKYRILSICLVLILISMIFDFKNIYEYNKYLSNNNKYIAFFKKNIFLCSKVQSGNLILEGSPAEEIFAFYVDVSE
jgi:hypothetical protein